MSQRRFLIASALARLIRKEQGVAGRIVEGYFPARPDREHFVSIEPSHCYLVLATGREGAGVEEQAEVPRSQAEALLAVCAGKVGFEATIVRLRGGKEALLQRFIAPGSLDRISVEFEEGEDAAGFVPPAWFGPEVTQNTAYDRGSLARVGIPAPEEIPLSNAMLDQLLDTLEEGTIAAQLGRGASPQATEARSDRRTEVASSGGPDELSAPPPESPRRDDLMTGRAEALEGQAPHLVPDTEENSVVRSFRWRKS